MPLNLYGRFRRITSNQQYLPEIDGIRFLAISLVIVYHVYKYFISHLPIAFTDNPDSYSFINAFLDNSTRGVELFFVLSGFILCLPFAHQYIGGGKKISLKHYYLRRVTRLEPPYFIAITGIFLLQVFVKGNDLSVMLPSWLASLAYSHNVIFHTESLITVVAWSLEVEIQFYILAPLFFRMLMLPLVPRRVALVATIIGIITMQHFYPAHVTFIYGYLHYFFIGILLADLYVSDTLSTVLKKPWIPLVALACLVGILALPYNRDYEHGGDTLLPLKMLFPFSIGVFYICVLKNDLLKQIFSYKFIPIIGGMCYSIYLLHYTIIGVLGRVTGHFTLTTYYLPNFLLQLLLLTIPILLVSSVFYLLIERPFMSSKWTHKLLKKSNKDDLTDSTGTPPPSAARKL